MTEFKKSITRVVLSEVNASISKKSTGTKIATKTRVIPVTVIKPFSK